MLFDVCKIRILMSFFCNEVGEWPESIDKITILKRFSRSLHYSSKTSIYNEDVIRKIKVGKVKDIFVCQ